MTGICGWSGRPEDDRPSDAVLTAMADGLPRFEGYRAETAAGKRGGLAVVGPPLTTHLYADDRFIAALNGYPAWSCERLAETAAAHGHGAALAEGFRERGAGLLGVLDGSFSLAVVDHDTNQALLAVDRLGVEPLCYGFPESGGVVFGTTTDSLRAYPGMPATIPPQRLYDFLFWWRIPAPSTIYAEQRKLLAGQYLLHTAEQEPRPDFYWRMPYREDAPIRVEEAHEELRMLLRRAVSRTTGGEPAARLGAFLSGGLDSSTIVGLLAESRGEPPRAFTVSFDEEGYDELAYAEIAARHFGAEHSVYSMTPRDIFETLPTVAAATDEPFGNASALPAFCCARLARATGVEAVLAGDGGDELFAGNTRYRKHLALEYYLKLPQFLRLRVAEPLLLRIPHGDCVPIFGRARSHVRRARVPLPDRIESYNHFAGVDPTDIFDPSIAGEIALAGPLTYLRDAYERTPSTSTLHRMMHLDLQITLADSDFRKVNVACELAGVRVRYPFADRELVEFSARIPPAMLIERGELRSFYKRALAEFLPREVLTKPKHGFGLPVNQWFTTFQPLRELTGDCLESLRRRRFFRPLFIDRCQDVLMGKDTGIPGGNLYDLVVFEIWLEAHVDR